jgi:hypothetical protein
MTAKILNFILSYSKLGKFLDGHKTIIGASLLLVVKVLEGLQAISPLFPTATYLGQAEDSVRDALNVTISTLEALGYSFASIGLARKYVKAKLPDGK